MSQHADAVWTVPEQKGQPLALDTPAATGEQPSSIGRYRVERLLGQGGFGRVYLAHDDQLHRRVAIKVPRPERVGLPGYADTYLAEARILASLDHPHIVPVHDVGQTDDGLPFVVSKFIEGTDLAGHIRQAQPSFPASAALVATVAEALHHAHRQGLVHRDIKPGNILLEWRAGGVSPPVPYVADFGLALREEEFGKGAGYAGTPAYMSPEEARNEGHRVDGRSDLFSLGVVFYELLTGRRPFRGETREELLEQITCVEPRPLRQVDDTIPRELERICLKALAKRATERYLTGLDLADDLHHFLDDQKTACGGAFAPPEASARPQAASQTPPATVLPTPAPIRIVPKGLRSFDAHDADFFLELLPGPRDRQGLPDSIHFWKTRIEETDPDNTFAVGLIYGPSGCGKSSLLKAGLLPRLVGRVVTVHVEATANDTEARLLRGLRKNCPNLPDGLGLIDTVAALRRGRGLAAGNKVLIVLDQFEQWLHGERGALAPRSDGAELVRALRQCDGSRVQCLVLVRDDFWMAATRFLKELEVRLVDGQNSAAVDLFDVRHARRVLAAFGRAFGALPGTFTELTKAQDDFLDQAVAGLAQERKVISVRLVLFAEMVKGMPWTPATLHEVGGTAGVGVTFLEETFSAAGAPPEHRYHQKAARAVLKALLPESGSDIKGHMRSYAELLAASGYIGRSRDFDDLLGILDRETRLITPTDPAGQEEDEATVQVQAGQKYYQLTHDYLVPSLRNWLTRKQRETRRGRAELRLAERTALWTHKPENRHLPAWWEWANIRLFTGRRDWSPAQRRLMRRAGRYHAVRGTLLALLLALLTFGGWWTFGALRARALVDTLLVAKTADVPELVHSLEPYRRWADPSLRDTLTQENLGDGRRLHVALALLPVDPSQADFLCDRLLNDSGPEEVKVIRASLYDHTPDLATRFWAVLQGDAEERPRRLRAACVLALSDGQDPRWAAVGDQVVRYLAGENLLFLRDWAALLEPVQAHLIPHQVRRLVEADAGEFAAYLAMLRAYPEDAPAALHGQLERSLPAAARTDDRQALARQQAQAAVALLHLGRSGRAWPLFHQGDDPTCRTYLIHRCATLGVDPAILASHLLGDEESDPSIRQGLLLALGEYSADQRAEVVRGPLVASLLGAYRDDPDPGIHSAVAWLAARWQMADRLPRIEASPGRQPREITKPRWYVNSQGRTFAAIPAPGPFEIGSPKDERGRFGDAEDRRSVRIDYPFAVAIKPVTVAEFQKFRPDFAFVKPHSPGADTPINSVSWYDAAAYCNWLSEQEKIPNDQWCYEPNARGEYWEGMTLKASSWELSGYRLPREAEWEYACRAGTVTAWSCGSDESLLGNYAWYSLNSNATMHPVGMLKPNGLGLFDVHGNAWQWCQNAYVIPNDNKDKPGKVVRIMHGGSFYLDARNARSAYRSWFEPALRSGDFGFRVARTLR